MSDITTARQLTTPPVVSLNTMCDQMSLPGLDAETPPFKPAVIDGRPGQPSAYNLFLAVLPEPEDAQRIARVAANLRERNGLVGKCLRAERLHITLQALASFHRMVPQAVLDAAVAAAASVDCPPLPIVLDRACSFPNVGSRGHNAFVLRCDARSDTAIARLRQSLTIALRRTGLRAEPSGTPHMTMLYDQRVVPEQVIQPLHWTATSFALILSHVGLAYHQQIARWSLADRA
jgi:2'-5' RNA ligase